MFNSGHREEAVAIQGILQAVQLGRKIDGLAACLLPYEESGEVAWDSLAASIERTNAAGLRCAVNMDTGYANYLTDEERRAVLKLTEETCQTSGSGFVAGVFVEELEGDLVDLYRRQMEVIVSHGGTPILFQTSRIHEWGASQIADLYAKVCDGFESVLAFELGQMFAPNGLIFDLETIKLLMQIPALKGMKHSSLSRLLELERLALRDEVRPDFRIYTGNDLGINMIEYGSDYLLGLAAFCPEKFAERDRYWEEGDARYYELSDALQHLGNVAFRAPVPAYKHSCAVFQHLIGRAPSSLPHPQCPTRPAWEAEILTDCVQRLGYSARS